MAETPEPSVRQQATSGDLLPGATIPIAWGWRSLWGAIGLIALCDFLFFVLFKMVEIAPARSVGFFACLLSIMALPIFLSGTYVASLRRTHQLALFRDGGFVRAYFGGRFFRSVIWLVLSVALAMTVFVGATDADQPRRAALLVPPVLWPIYAVTTLLLRSEVAAPYRHAIAMTTALWLTPLILVGGRLWDAAPVVRYFVLRHDVRRGRSDDFDGNGEIRCGG